MASIKVNAPSGEQRHIEIVSGWSLMETLRDHGYDEIAALCGGCCSCATCHVYVNTSDCSALPVMDEDELMLLEMEDNYNAETSRLSCQITLDDSHDGMEVTIVDVD